MGKGVLMRYIGRISGNGYFKIWTPGLSYWPSGASNGTGSSRSLYIPSKSGSVYTMVEALRISRWNFIGSVPVSLLAVDFSIQSSINFLSVWQSWLNKIGGFLIISSFFSNFNYYTCWSFLGWGTGKTIGSGGGDLIFGEAGLDNSLRFCISLVFSTNVTAFVCTERFCI